MEGEHAPRGTHVFSQSLPLLEQAIPFLIGKNGKSIQRITTLTSTQIHISESPMTTVGQTWRYATIRGELRNIAKAKQLLVLYLCRWCVMSANGDHGIKGVDSKEEAASVEETPRE